MTLLPRAVSRPPAARPDGAFIVASGSGCVVLRPDADDPTRATATAYRPDGAWLVEAETARYLLVDDQWLKEPEPADGGGS